MFGALWDTAFQVAVSPFRWPIEKGKEGAGRIRNQMEARAAYVPGQPQEGQDNVEVLADWAASWRRRVYGMAPPLQAGGGNVGGANLPLDGGGAGAINEKKLVSQEAGRTRDGSATPAVQWGSVPRRLFIPALQ